MYCILVLCDDTVLVFTAGWCPGMLHSLGGHKSGFHCKLVSHCCVLANCSFLTVGCWQHYFYYVKIMIGCCNALVLV